MGTRLARSSLSLSFLAALACTDDEPTDHAEAIGSIYVPDERTMADVLLVIDDSPSMRTFAGNGDLAGNLAAFAELIEDHETRFDIRFAITTTSVPGPTCVGPLARGGELLTDTCASQPDLTFVGPAELETEVLDLQAACTDVCPLAQLDLRPSPIADYQTELAIRPWIEADNNSYRGNLPSDVTLEQALVCAGMRGFAGCEYESPLAAASRALEHMRTPGDPAHGFLRDGAKLLIVFIGDEDDCSHPDASATIFDPDGQDVFWTDPDGPSSGVCHRASTACDEDGCEVIDRDRSGEPTEAFADAALTSLIMFEAELETLRQEREVLVSLVGGVDQLGTLRWPTPTADDQARVEEFGWAPGCDGPDERFAQPPGRIHSIISPGAAYSICEPNWTPVLEPLATIIKGGCCRTWLAPIGIADADPDFPGLQPDCELRVRTAIDELWPIPQCLRDEQGWIIDPEIHDYRIPDDADRCWAWLSDPDGQTEDVHDDLWPEVVEDGHLAQLLISTRPGVFLPRGSIYESVCTPE